MNVLSAIVRKELSSYFSTPVAYVFLFIFLAASHALTFYVGHFYERGQADLLPFFNFHPWLYLFFMPALSMRLWAEERRSGSVELLLTLPVRVWQAVVGKFLAAWLFALLALALSFPIWLTVNYLGDPDNGVILVSYMGSAMMGAGFLAIGACISAMTRNQVVAFIITVTVCFLFLLSGHSMVLSPLLGWAPDVLIDAVASLSFLTHFTSMTKGVIDARDLIYFLMLVGFWLYANVLIVEWFEAR